MVKQLEVIRKTRVFLFEQVKDLSTEELNRIFPGFNNNIIWNLGHMIAAQQGICYKRSGLRTLITDDFWERYRTGSKPETPVTDDEIAQIKQLLFSTLDQFDVDYHNQIFSNYTAWVTRYGVELASLDDGLELLQYHEGLHSGMIMSLKRLTIK